MYMRKFSILISILFSAVSLANAQRLSNAETREMNAEILRVIETYESAAPLYTEDAEYQFRSLFKDENAPVFCDIMGNRYFLNQIPASQYLEYALANSKSASATIKLVRKGTPVYDSGLWLTKVTFNKSFSYIDINDVLFSPDEYFDHVDFSIEVTIAYDSEKTGYITNISGSFDSDKRFPSGRYLVVKRNGDEDDVLSYQNKKLKFNSFDQAFVEPGSLSSLDPDLRIFADTLGHGDRYSMVQYHYKTANLRVKARFSYAPFSAYKVEFNMQSNVGSSKSSAMEFGVDLGYAFRLGKKAKMSINAGVAMSKSNIFFSAENVSYSYLTSDASNGQLNTYTRSYSIQSATEGLGFTDIVCPLYFEGEHRLSPVVSIIWDLGAKAYFNGKIDTDSEPYTVSGSVSGKVGSSSLSGVYTQFMVPGTYNRTKTDITAFANLGADFNVFKNTMYISLLFGYEMAFSPSYNPGRSAWYYSSENIYPFVYNANLNRDVAVASFINCVSYTRNAIWATLGFKFKF